MRSTFAMQGPPVASSHITCSLCYSLCACHYLIEHLQRTDLEGLTCLLVMFWKLRVQVKSQRSGVSPNSRQRSPVHRPSSKLDLSCIFILLLIGTELLSAATCETLYSNSIRLASNFCCHLLDFSLSISRFCLSKIEHETTTQQVSVP